MSKMKLAGSFVALITPFNRDGGPDFEGFRTLLQFHRQHGTSAVLIMGSTGEVSMLSPEERHQIVRETLKHKTDDMKLFYGCTGANTQATIDYVAQAAAEGADGAIIAAPAYICAPNADIVRFFLDVADAATIPIGIYNNPPRVQTDLTAQEILRLAEHPNIVVNKESTTRSGQVAQVAAGRPDMALMCCCSPNLGLVVPTMALGGHGTANMTGNLIPEEMAVISTPWRDDGDAERCREAYLRNLPMLHFAYSAINPVAVKSLMRAIGMPAGELRRPLQPLEGQALQAGLDVVRELGLDKKYGYSLKPSAVAA
ncbi:MAG: 4-hydroxy-tetrahydrodipicolinate synthase [Alphaproteobacteria bacterium]|jgi:4-hydroxy-tetrahydrodipicolinate synthase|nr:4-hydroxy-tetrahydrodipicolinate synthase [Alphaproteobacteria bacterium]MDP6566680.1 4-hydroxy-tetrahydrodipicolinate synthase [Alphaproteobacteria bacterium]MDP6813026.1 4-hydroxy-tetrahydrodipicolinate synthase [Alphaproteobacteria bacterium]